MVKTITQDNFETEVLGADRTVMLDFWAPWCGPCQMLGPVVEAVAEEFSDKIDVGKLNVDENKELAQTYGVRGIPTLLFFKEGKEIKRIVGAQNKTLLTQTVSELE
jgi:thioredoxin 1